MGRQQCGREAGVVTSGSHSGHLLQAGSEGTGPPSAPVAMTGAVVWRLQQQTVFQTEIAPGFGSTLGAEL